MKVWMEDKLIKIDNVTFNIKGVAYSPVPIGQSSVFNAPYGDYGAVEHRQIWERDLPLIKDMGANTIRVYTWREEIDHWEFLDEVHKNGLKIVITFFLGTSTITPAYNEYVRQQAVDRFAALVGKYSRHPAILGWTFGNEVNGDWQGFIQALGEERMCGWQVACWYNSAGWCSWPRWCVYGALFDWIEQAGAAAIEAMGEHRKLLLTSFADVDNIEEAISWHDWKMKSLDAWGVQVYRGRGFGDGPWGNIMQHFPTISSKPLVITEYGVDAYNDPCGWCDQWNCETPCYNRVYDPPWGWGENQDLHADWNSFLTQQIKDHWEQGVLGGFIMSWVDEYWKNAISVKGCWPQYYNPGFDPRRCDWKAHVDCPEIGASEHGLCGYWLSSTFDHYVNEAWYGINSVQKNPKDQYGPDVITPRKLFYALQYIYEGNYPRHPFYTQAWFIATAVFFAVGAVPVLLHELRRSKDKMNAQHQQNLAA